MLECGVGRAPARIQEHESENTKTQGRHFDEKIASCGFRVLEFEEAGKGAPAHRKHEETPAHTFCELGF
ncbi:hypothetical protein BGK38_03440 [Corynebacterium diphtheriae]|nr:hypothetical protein BGK38_03440 [Corynebacterium diphtheriae]OEH69690.1 hypothetical protein BHU47_04340 [Corynebacterium diphtheriae]OEH70314.1 hypothetical protein BHU48_05905 [Corynebacterium diphtheriae]OLN20100.1 hypothetical protein BUE67_05115 [Corynebacterium diphtheriae]OLO14682.1 hypothetical protein BUV99_03815 [Corynebacterium diphtheriae]